MENKLVRKSNALIEASYKLTTQEQRVILFLVSQIKPEDDDFKDYLIPIKDFADLVGTQTKAKYQEIKKITKKLISRVFTINNQGQELQISWLSSANYLKGEGQVVLSFDRKLKPFLLHLKSHFTKYRLKLVMQLKSSFSIRIYELLKQYQKLKERVFELSMLRKHLGLDAGQYKNFNDFKRFVILVAQKELAEKTDLSFEFEPIKTGRSVTKIRFLISVTNQAESKPIAPFTPNFQEMISSSEEKDNAKFQENLGKLFEMLPKTFQGKKTIEKLIADNLEKHDFNYVSRNIHYTNANSTAAKPGLQNAKGSNYRNYLNKALKEDYGLAYQEDLEAASVAEKEEIAKVAEETERQRKVNAKIEAEREAAIQARQYLNGLEQKEFDFIKKQAIKSLSPEEKETLLEGRLRADYTVKKAMEKIVQERLNLSPEE
jgi:plasmid replication initiation protein